MKSTLRPNLSFQRIQYAFARRIRDPENAPAPPDIEARRMKVYEDLFFNNLSSLLAGTFPVLHAILGRVRQPWVPAEKHRAVILEARLYLAAYALALAGSIALETWALVWLWIVPGLFGQFFLRHYLLAEHTGCALKSDMLEMTRTIHTNVVARFLAWNMPYHTEHHAYPSVPFHALPALHAQMQPRLVHETRGYVRTLAAIVSRAIRRGAR